MFLNPENGGSEYNVCRGFCVVLTLGLRRRIGQCPSDHLLFHPQVQARKNDATGSFSVWLDCFCGRRFSRKVLLGSRVRNPLSIPPTHDKTQHHTLLSRQLQSSSPRASPPTQRGQPASSPHPVLSSHPIHFVENILSKRPGRFKNPALAERGHLTLSQAPSKRGIARRVVIVSAQGTGRPWAATLVSHDRYPIPTPPRSSEASGHLENPGTASQRGCMSRHRGKIPNLKSHPPPLESQCKAGTQTHICLGSGF